MKTLTLTLTLMLMFTIFSTPLKAQETALEDMISSHKALEDTSKNAAHQFLKMLQNAPHGKSCHRCPVLQDSIQGPMARPMAQGPVTQKSSNSALGSQDSAPQAEMLVFVSLSLGSSTLKQLYKDSHKIGGRLILRGLYKDSFRLTQQKIRTLKIVVDIDPTLFERFKIREVPTFILTEPYQDNQPFQYDQIAGNITLSYALEQFQKEGELKAATIFLTKLQEKTHG